MKKRIIIIFMAIALLFVGCEKIKETKLVYKTFSPDEEWKIDVLGNASRSLGMIYNQDDTDNDRIGYYPVSLETPSFLLNEIQVNPDKKHHYDGKDHVFEVTFFTNLENISEYEDYKLSPKDIVLKINGNKMKLLKDSSNEIEIKKLRDKKILLQYYTEKDISEVDTIEVTFKNIKKRLSIIVNK